MSQIVSLITALLLAASPAPPSPQPSPGPTAEQAEPRRVEIVVLVDESGSLSAEGVAQERQAAARIPLAVLAEDAKVAIFGFGSQGSRGRVAKVCPMTELNETGRQDLTQCVGGLKLRTAEEGYHTDFVNALSTAGSAFSDSGDRTARIIFLLTDGKLHVGDDPSFGDGDRDAVAAARLTERVLPDLEARGIQVWPLGFGEVDPDALRSYAVGGAQGRCNADAPTPKAIVRATAAEMDNAVSEAIAAAQCSVITDTDDTVLDPGGRDELQVTIPKIASAGSIEVIKRDPRIQVSYTDPDGRLVNPAVPMDGSTFVLSGQNAAVESLRVNNPKPGEWTVHLTAPAGGGSQNVSARVTWQGQLDSEISVSDAAPEPGQSVTVQLKLVTRDELAPEDLAEVEGISFSAAASGPGLKDMKVPLNDSGQAPDAAGGDGLFSGTFQVPEAATGTITLVGEVGGPGLVGDSVPFPMNVSTGGKPVKTQLTVDPAPVSPGGAVKGAVEVENTLTTPLSLRLTVSGLPSGAAVSVRPPVVAVPAAGRSRTEFEIVVGEGSELGSWAGRIKLVQGEGQDEVVHFEGGFPLTVTEPPSLLARLWWLWTGLAVALAALGALLLLLARRRAADRDVGGLTAVLLQGETAVFELNGRKGSDEFRFAVRTDGAARLDTPTGPADTYVARRGERGRIVLRTPMGDVLRLGLNEPGIIQGDLALEFRDARGRSPQPQTVPYSGPYSGPDPDPPRPADPWDDLLY
ncbi:hypothetical protein Aph01nite_14130 [Acrocarpospora phusangensis]|uniref:VWFA domain-containing protein n=1 Tax=Acrocarpospora phusangensis TaxID=1070424 RepID=A0A919UMA9_9ACTN|nr:vWA domain-containing protein [Acrocarpospora phusangensis]GIH23103.1 hypothetical protein Aph01nite_14130 [Acrocarpospora phusangensis]